MSQGPEMWINEPGDDGSPYGGSTGGADSGSGGRPGNGSGPGGGSGGGRGRGRMRWIALVAGFAVLIAVIVTQHYLGGPNDVAAPPSPTTGQSVTPPATTSETVTPTSRTDTSPTDELSRTSSSTRSSQDGDNSTTGDQAAPSGAEDASSEPVTTTGEAALPDSAGWELVGLQSSDEMGTGPNNVIRYQPESGQMVTTRIPALDSNGPLSFVVTDTAAIVRPDDFVAGYLVEDGKPATTLQGVLTNAGGAWPGPDGNHAWVYSFDDDSSQLDEVDDHGEKTGKSLAVPEVFGQAGGSSYLFGSDGAGYVFATGVGGTYDLRPDGAHLVTHGQVLAIGPTSLLVYECTDAAVCSAAAVDRNTGAKQTTEIDGLTPAPAYFTAGTTSPDGHYAAMADRAGDSSITLIDLESGDSRDISFKSHVAGLRMPSTSPLAFTPGSDYLLVATSSGVVPIDTATGKDLDTLPIPSLSDIAIRPAH